eukprot:421513-Amphidinium_carterae.1
MTSLQTFTVFHTAWGLVSVVSVIHHMRVNSLIYRRSASRIWVPGCLFFGGSPQRAVCANCNWATDRNILIDHPGMCSSRHLHPPSAQCPVHSQKWRGFRDDCAPNRVRVSLSCRCRDPGRPSFGVACYSVFNFLSSCKVVYRVPCCPRHAIHQN